MAEPYVEHSPGAMLARCREECGEEEFASYMYSQLLRVPGLWHEVKAHIVATIKSEHGAAVAASKERDLEQVTRKVALASGLYSRLQAALDEHNIASLVRVRGDSILLVC